MKNKVEWTVAKKSTKINIRINVKTGKIICKVKPTRKAIYEKAQEEIKNGQYIGSKI